jgi:hypothetical protein
LFLTGAIAVRMARGIGASFITTSLAEATTGITAVGTTSITAEEVLNAIASVDPA